MWSRYTGCGFREEWIALSVSFGFFFWGCPLLKRENPVPKNKNKITPGSHLAISPLARSDGRMPPAWCPKRSQRRHEPGLQVPEVQAAPAHQPPEKGKKTTAKKKKNRAPLPCDPFRLMPQARTAVCVCFPLYWFCGLEGLPSDRTICKKNVGYMQLDICFKQLVISRLNILWPWGRVCVCVWVRTERTMIGLCNAKSMRKECIAHARNQIGMPYNYDAHMIDIWLECTWHMLRLQEMLQTCAAMLKMCKYV